MAFVGLAVVASGFPQHGLRRQDEVAGGTSGLDTLTIMRTIRSGLKEIGKQTVNGFSKLTGIEIPKPDSKDTDQNQQAYVDDPSVAADPYYQDPYYDPYGQAQEEKPVRKKQFNNSAQRE